MSLPNALADYYMNQVAATLVVTLVILSLACCGGWYCGDRFNIPSIEVHAR